MPRLKAPFVRKCKQKGLLLLNVDATETLVQSNSEYVVLSFSHDKKALYIEPLPLPKGAIARRLHSDVSCKGSFRLNASDIVELLPEGKLYAEWSELSNRFVVNLAAKEN